MSHLLIPPECFIRAHFLQSCHSDNQEWGDANHCKATKTLLFTLWCKYESCTCSCILCKNTLAWSYADAGMARTGNKWHLTTTAHQVEQYSKHRSFILGPERERVYKYVMASWTTACVKRGCGGVGLRSFCAIRGKICMWSWNVWRVKRTCSCRALFQSL